MNRSRLRSHTRLPRSVWALGVVSLFMDASSELVHSLLPMYLVTGLGASMVVIGFIEGSAEATAQIVKIFSGALSDYLGKRKLLTVIGYAMAALSKPIFPLAGSISWVFAARVLDRIGKGIRGAPRDALIADVTPAALRGAAFGLRQALDSIGAFIGPLLALGLMLVFANDLKLALWFAVIPAIASVVVLVVGVEESKSTPTRSTPAAGKSLAWQTADRLSRRYWWAVGLGAVFTLARFSEAFLIIRGQELGLGLGLAPAVLTILSFTYAVVAYPAGVAADRVSARSLLELGLGLLVLADWIFALADGRGLVLLGAALWGAHLGLTQGLFNKLVADTAPAGLVGTAFGIFNLVSGVALLAASVIAGVVWEAYGPAATFYVGAAFAGIAMMGLVVTRSGRGAAT